MYNNKITWFLLLIIFVFSFGVFFRNKQKITTKNTTSLFSYKEIAEASEMQYRNLDEDLSLKKIELGWYDSEKKRLIQLDEVRKLLDGLSEMRVISTQNSKDIADLGFGENEKIFIQMNDANHKNLVELFVGSNGETEGTFFVKKGESSEVILVKGNKKIFDMRIADVTHNPSDL